MELETRIAPGAAIVSTAGAVVAAWQGVAASKSAKAADRQAKAAEDQVQLMRLQLAGDDHDRHTALTPVFEVTGHLELEGLYNNEPRGLVTLSQKGGAALESVTARASGADVKGLYPQADSSVDYRRTPEVDLGPMTDGTEQSLGIGFDYQVMSPVRVELVFTCRQRNGSGEWNVPRVVTLSELPPPPQDPRFLGTRGRRL
ncbi:hypothetical protein ACTU45_28125 [Streptomyces sp. 24-1644]|uniref:hypothetical protein n=1 Tax=Streptomyces sp. 24-1644 TaxID=3457315 RepID=UPI003FA6FD6A